MKRGILALGLVLSLVFVTAESARAYQSAGCGLGAEIFEKDDVSQVFAAMTNITAFNQMFAITSGTSGCRETQGAQQNARIEQERFVTTNFDNLMMDMASGEGEYLDSFSWLLGCPSPEFKNWSQTQFKKLDLSTPKSLLKSTLIHLKQNQNLAQSCSLVG